MGLRKRATILIKALQPVKQPPSKTSLLESIARGAIVVSSRSKSSWVTIPTLANIFDLQHHSCRTHGVRFWRSGTFMQSSRPHTLGCVLALTLVLVGIHEASV